MTPKLRFNGFNEPWQEKKLGEIATFSKGQGYSKSDIKESGFPIILYGQLYTNYSINICKPNTYADFHDYAVMSKGGEVIIPASGETPEDIAVASAVLNSGIILGGDLNILSLSKDIINPSFAAIAISNSKTSKILSQFAQGKSVVHLNSGSISKAPISFPSLAEQEAIGEYFKQLDELIAKSQLKIDRLKQVKKASLQAMFPQDGQQTPTLRFNGFNEPWKEVKLGDVATILGGGTPSTSDKTNWGGDIQWFTPSEVGQTKYVSNSIRTITKKGFVSSSTNLLPIGTILLSSRATIGEASIATSPCTTNQGFQSLIPLNMDVEFLFALIQTKKKTLIELSTGSTFLEISRNKVKNIDILVPSSLAEQEAIGKYFSELDKQIELSELRLAKLRQVKQASLDLMFV